jgi:hypothetical protein
MPIGTVVGYFPDVEAAEGACSGLIEAGVARHRIALRRLAVGDALAVSDPERVAHCEVSVVSAPRDWERVSQVMARHGARRTLLRR